MSKSKKVSIGNNDLITRLKDAAEAALKEAKAAAANDIKDSQASDAIPLPLQARYLVEMRKLGQGGFWYDQAVLCMDLGLRNIEARELSCRDIFLPTIDEDGEEVEGYIYLSDSKQVRSFTTKAANLSVKKSWITYAQKMLCSVAISQGDDVRKHSADDAGDEDTGCDKALVKIAIKLDVEEEYMQEREMHYWRNIGAAKVAAWKMPEKPAGRIIFFKNYPNSLEVIVRRLKQAQDMGSPILFPCCLLSGSRAAGQGFKATTRQTSYRMIILVRDKLKSYSDKFKKLLKNNRLGLHSARKSAVQRIFKKTGDLMKASIFIGHGGGKGDCAITQVYLDKSKGSRKAVYKETGQDSAYSAVYEEAAGILAME